MMGDKKKKAKSVYQVEMWSDFRRSGAFSNNQEHYTDVCFIAKSLKKAEKFCYENCDWAGSESDLMDEYFPWHWRIYKVLVNESCEYNDLVMKIPSNVTKPTEYCDVCMGVCKCDDRCKHCFASLDECVCVIGDVIGDVIGCDDLDQCQNAMALNRYQEIIKSTVEGLTEKSMNRIVVEYIMRRNKGKDVFTIEDRKYIARNLGDMLQDLAYMASKIGYPLEDIATINIDKLKRQKRENAE